MELVIYYRPSLFEEELEAAQAAGFKCVSCFSDLKSTDIVIPRYTTLPFAEDVYREFKNIGCHVVNEYNEHRFMADLFRWYPVLEDLTPKTYDQNSLSRLPESKSYVLKGETNSKKAYWNTHMFAENKKEAIIVFSKLVDDGLVGNQNIAIREYVPLKTYMIGINGMPVTREFRYFFLGDKLIGRGYYWQNYADELKPEHKALPEEIFSYKAFMDAVKSRMRDHAVFYCVDVAQTVNGDWIVVEVNDGTMAGLSCIDPGEFYRNLYEHTTNRFID